MKRAAPVITAAVIIGINFGNHNSAGMGFNECFYPKAPRVRFLQFCFCRGEPYLGTPASIRRPTYLDNIVGKFENLIVLYINMVGSLGIRSGENDIKE